MTEVVLKIGDKTDDGWIYAGESPDTHKSFYVAPKDDYKSNWFDAVDQAKYLQKWTKGIRLPTKNELNQIFNNKAKIGGFDASGEDGAGWYWSSDSIKSPYNEDYPWSKRFSDGAETYNRISTSSVRFVRD